MSSSQSPGPATASNKATTSPSNDYIPINLTDESTDLNNSDSQKESELLHDPDITKSIKEKGPLYVKSIDRLTFLLGVLNLIFLAIFTFGCYKPLLFYFTAFKFFTLIPLRFVIYREQQFGYFLLDYCYFANLVLLIYIWIIDPDPTKRSWSNILDQLGLCSSSELSVALFKAVYCSTTGPLIVAVFLFRNSLVFHSIDKLTSCFIHISPIINVFVIRWCFMEVIPETGPKTDSGNSVTDDSDLTIDYRIMTVPHFRLNSQLSDNIDVPQYFIDQYADADQRWWSYNIIRQEPFTFYIPKEMTFYDLRYPLYLWLFHQLLYTFTIYFIIPLPNDDCYQTTYRYLMKTKKLDKWFEKNIRIKNICYLGSYPALHPIIFGIMNFLFMAIVTIPSIWLYNDDTGVGILVFFFGFGIKCILNGASFYTDVFALKYAHEVENRAQKRSGHLQS